MLKDCYRGLAAACLAAGMCLPAFAQNQEGAAQQQPATPAVGERTTVGDTTAGSAGNTAGGTVGGATAGTSAETTGATPSDTTVGAGGGAAGSAGGTGSTMPRDRMSGGTMAGGSRYAMPNTDINWERRYELTPLEMKRLRAMGLRDREIFVAANTAMLTGRPIDDIVQFIFRGYTTEMLGQEFNIAPGTLEETNPMWTSPEWDQAVREGWWYMPASPMQAEGMTGTREAGSMERR